MALTEEEKKERKHESQRKWLEKQKELNAQRKTLEAEPDYEALYKKALEENNTLKAKVDELTKLCNSYAGIAEQNKQLLQKATVEYNSRVNYMLDCVRHAYVSMQFAQNASDKKGE